MTLRPPSPRPDLLPWLALLGLATFACGGEPFVAGEEQPLSSGGSAEQPTPPGTAGSLAGGSGSGGSGGSGSAGETSGPGGSSGSAGTASGGSPAAGAGGSIVEGPTMGGRAPVAFSLIDDVEGAFPALPERDGRRGGWYTVTDSSGQASGAEAVALDPAQPELGRAVRVGGGGFTGWGFELGVSLTSPVVGYDASRFCGVRFRAKGAAATWSLVLTDRLSVPQGGVCESNDSCHRFVAAPFSVDGQWREITVPFSALRLADAADPRRLDASGVYDILFHFQSFEGGGFELFVDDLAFIEPSGDRCGD